MGTTIVEHVVLFKAKDGVSKEDLQACMLRFRGLRELDGVIFLRAGALRACKAIGSAWTHVLYGRYKGKTALEAYAKHPAHLSAVAMADPLFQDKMALDWEASPEKKPLGLTSFTAAYIVLVKWATIHHMKAAEKLSSALLQALDSNSFQLSSSTSSSSSSSSPFSSARLSPSLQQCTSGFNFSPARARGFHWGFAALFGSTPAAFLFHDLVQELTGKQSVESFICLDYEAEDETLARL
ncbi:hypothetical protein KP509_32G011300 [Ceratopteris richardii]|uniref:Stress-response A/B barrel domain-containing protein n=1 Tax=Ceratopteris richardii TaxID=49495 RepID=A0A8T2QT43_CERRI|nr:hypothetical protein KP509_32G011300 [Ceratopteris richardii]